MKHSPRRLTITLAASLLASACSRELPSQWPEASPASSAAAELPPAPVTLAVDGDPPLPGEAGEGWIGLEQAPTAKDPHHGHRQHQHRPQPSSEAAASEGQHDQH